jgi:hypothetical protein
MRQPGGFKFSKENFYEKAGQSLWESLQIAGLQSLDSAV